MFKKWRLTDRTRTLLTLEIAIVLPAAALMGFSIWNLKHLQHSGGFEAAIQRELSHVLKIAEKKTLHQAIDLTTPMRTAFPNPDEDRTAIKAKLEHLLSEHPEFAFALFYDKKNNLLVSRTQPELRPRPTILRKRATGYQCSFHVDSHGSFPDGGAP
jgi:hypothetical protein